MKSQPDQSPRALLLEYAIAGKRALIEHPRRATAWYLAALIVSTLTFLVLTPVGSGDTDLWYHLNGGRLLWEFGDLPDTAFFSYTESADTWINYFWGFQALSYQIHALAGYEGLIAFRILLVGLAVGAIVGLLYRSDDSFVQHAWALALLALVLIVLTGRTSLIRPHLVSYMMITLFVLILERHPRWLPALPALALLWINMHGVEWPVGATICGAYFIERLWQWHRSGRAMDATTRATLIWTVTCLPAMLVNPFGIAVLTAPFNTPPDVYAYIGELQPLTVATLLSINLVGADIPTTTAISMLFYGNLLAYSAVLLRGCLRPAPLILSIIGLVLLTRGQRFMWEWLLLSLPLWRCAIDGVTAGSVDTTSSPPRAADAALALVLLSPFVSWFSSVNAVQSWPLDGEKLPVGVTEFIRAQGIEGRLMALPNSGGYLAWRLYPKMLISADMQTPPSTPWTHFRIDTAMRDQHALRRFVDEYQPELIAAVHNQTGIEELIKHEPQYRPVFFDDQFVLYASTDQLPQIVARFELKHVNPHNLLDDKLGSIDQRLLETRRVLAQYPDSDRVQHGMTRLLIDAERYDEALELAKHYLRTHPENPNSHFLTGNALEHLERCDEAMPYFEAAFEVASDDFHATLHRHLGSCAYMVKDFDAAYRHFEKGIKTYSESVEPEHRFQFALSAVAVGKEDKARTLLRHLLYAVDPADEVAINKAQALLADL